MASFGELAPVPADRELPEHAHEVGVQVRGLTMTWSLKFGVKGEGV